MQKIPMHTIIFHPVIPKSTARNYILGILFTLLTFFYVNRGKWFRNNFWLPFFDGLTRFGMPQHDLITSGKCLSVCDKKFVASIARELIQRI